MHPLTLLALLALPGCADDKSASDDTATPTPDSGASETGDPQETGTDGETGPGETGRPDTAPPDETGLSGETGDTGEPVDTGPREDSADPCDADGDGALAVDCGGADCDDGDPTVLPGATDAWDRLDNDCDGDTDRLLIEDAAYAATSGGEREGRITSIDNLVSGADVDGDGAIDLLIGSPFEASELGRLYALDAESAASWSGDVASDATWWVEGDGSRANLGFVSNALGDVDGDAVADVVVGARYAADGGRAYLFLGAARAGEVAVGDADLVVSGDDGGAAGWALDASGDLDGDGLADWAIGDGNAAQPKVGLFAGAGLGGGSASLLDADGLVTGDSGDRLGESVASGDVDGDGYADLLAGEPGADLPGGAVRVILGGASLPDGEATALVWLSTTDGGTGYMGVNSRGVGRPADLDASGAQDLAIADYQGSSTVYVWLDPSGGTLGPADADLSFTEPGSSAGSTIATGPLDADGYDDLVIGGYNDTTDGTSAGSVYLVWGASFAAGTALDRSTADGLFEAGAPERYLGTAVSLPGDLTGDGVGDLLIGASWDSTLEYRGGTVYAVAGR